MHTEVTFRPIATAQRPRAIARGYSTARLATIRNPIRLMMATVNAPIYRIHIIQQRRHPQTMIMLQYGRPIKSMNTKLTTNRIQACKR